MGEAKQDTTPFHRIRWLAVVGGFLDGVRNAGCGRDAYLRTASRMFRNPCVGIVWVDVWENVRGVP